ncbi:hypothetical protein NDU88_006548 [Pleurodeles waltl]|uniref:Uncharacterized protein n=1 Tax=Pleurodeles waltl TaxID=8319 RepID=A0AAV7L4D8_PLEWA|nr:hypothetical protein NDU88_006548 [Pleurodeles waltl]
MSRESLHWKEPQSPKERVLRALGFVALHRPRGRPGLCTAASECIKTRDRRRAALCYQEVRGVGIVIHGAPSAAPRSPA